MVKDLFKKIINDWYVWVLVYVVMQFFKMAGDWGWYKEMPFAVKLLLRLVLEGGLMMVLMHRWKFPNSWLLVFIIAAAALEGLDIISISMLGLSVLFLGYYFQEASVKNGVEN